MSAPVYHGSGAAGTDGGLASHAAHEYPRAQMAIEIREARGDKKRTRDFLDVVRTIYRDDASYVRPLDMEIEQTLDPKKNPFFEHGEATAFVAYRDGVPVGRITASIDFDHLTRYRDDTGFFGFFETVDDPEVATALEAAEVAAQDGRRLQVVDLRSIVPFDDETVTRAVRSTGRAVVIAEAAGFAGVASEIAARVSERCFHHLAAPVTRVTGFDIPFPPPKLEHFQLPGVDRILDAVDALQWEDS